MNVRLNKTSTFVALRNPVYRKLWFAILLSGTCVAAQDTAATWPMNMLGSSTFLLSLISTVASLPFFLFTLPAGALTDMVNRRKLLCFMNLWLAGAAVLLAVLGSFQLLNPYVLLFCVLLIGVGFAFHAPAWSAIVPDVVTDEELPSAAALGGLQLNISGIIGPALGGVLLYFLGKLGFCGERPLLRCGNSRPVAMERARSGIRIPGGKFPRIIFYRSPICSVFARDSSRADSEHPFCFFYLCYTGADTRHRAEGTSPSTL